MRGFKIFLSLAGLATIVGCNREGNKVFLAEPGQNAYVRFINAIPDSGSQDWRFVDAVEGSPSTTGMPFRGIFPGATYQAATAGRRHLKVFQSSFDPTFADPTKATPEIVSTVFVDSTFSLETGKHYTIAAVGSLRAKTAKFVILTDDYADPGTSIAVRAVNLGTPTPLDVYTSPTGGTSALPAPFAAALAPFAATTWKTSAPGALTLRANAAGSTALPAMVDAAAPAGVAADKVLNLSAIGGATIAGTAFTAFLFPAATTGSLAATVVAGTCPTRCATAGVVYAVDKYPPSGF